MASTLPRDDLMTPWSGWPGEPTTVASTTSGQMFFYNADPNGVITVERPAQCYAADGRVWKKMNSGVNSTGWVLTEGAAT